MQLSGTHRPTTTHDETPAEPIAITAEGQDFAAARQALRDQVPDGHQLLHIIVVG